MAGGQSIYFRVHLLLPTWDQSRASLRFDGDVSLWTSLEKALHLVSALKKSLKRPELDGVGVDVDVEDVVALPVVDGKSAMLASGLRYTYWSELFAHLLVTSIQTQTNG